MAAPQTGDGLLLKKWLLLGHAASTTKLGRVALAVLWRLCERYNASEGAAWPSFNKLAKDSGASARQVKRAVDELEQAGLIAIVRGNRLRSNRYRPAFEAGDTHDTNLVPSASSCGDMDGMQVVSSMSPESIYQSGHKGRIEINEISETLTRSHTPPDGAGEIADASPALRGVSEEVRSLCAEFWRHYPERIGVAKTEQLIAAMGGFALRC